MAAKRFEYAASLEPGGAVLAEAGSRVELSEAWLPEHLVLVAVAQCSLASLRYYARESTVSGSAEAAGVVSRRDDGSYAFVELEVLLDVELDPPVELDELPALLARAERGCFIGNSLTARPQLVWRVNGAHVEVPD
jgi:organic hydroperoxide reductase OsmC/OhrA